MKRNKKGQFVKGFKPWNRGTKGVMKTNSGSFKKGDNAIPLKERFEAKVVLNSLTECWGWTGHYNNKGYGVINVRDRGGVKLAHRISWELKFGAVGEGVKVLHKCDNRGCVNPDHLFLGSQKDNMRDMSKKGRWGNQYYKNI